MVVLGKTNVLQHLFCSDKTTDLSRSSDGQHKRRHSGAAEVQEATLRNDREQV